MRTAAYKKPWGTPVPGVRRQSRSSAIHTLQTLADFKNRPRRQESLFDGLILQTRGGLVDHFDRTGIGRTRPPQVALAFVQLPESLISLPKLGWIADLLRDRDGL